MTDVDKFWGEMIEGTINFGREYRYSNIKKINNLDSKFEKFTHCSHVMIYSKSNSDGTFQNKACILMQMRFDGCLGFPGGVAEANETPLQAVCREVKEEVGWAVKEGEISEEDFQFKHVDVENELVFHFFATEVSEVKLKEIELNLTRAPDYGTEVLGHFRVPLYTMGDAFRGFPAFLKNQFVGNAKLQLIEAIENLKLLTQEQIIQALHSAPKITY